MNDTTKDLKPFVKMRIAEPVQNNVKATSFTKYIVLTTAIVITATVITISIASVNNTTDSSEPMQYNYTHQSYPNFELPEHEIVFNDLESVEQVIFVGFDGLGSRNIWRDDDDPDSFADLQMPSLFQFLKESIWTKGATIDRRNWSGPNWHGIISGLSSDDSGVVSNDAQTSINNNDKTIFEIAYERGLSSCVFADWQRFYDFGNHNLRNTSICPHEINGATNQQCIDLADTATKNIAQNWLQNLVVPSFATYDLMFVSVNGYDHAGHRQEWGGYHALGQFYETNLLKPLWEYVQTTEKDVAVVISADHGQVLSNPTIAHDRGLVPLVIYRRGSDEIEVEEAGRLANTMVAGIIAKLLPS